MKTRSAKSKGRRCSQETKDLLLKHAPNLQEDDIVVTPSGLTGADLTLSPAAQEIYPIVVENKNTEKINIWSAIEQCEHHYNPKGHQPVVFFRRNRTKLYATVDAEFLVKLLASHSEMRHGLNNIGSLLEEELKKPVK